MTPGGSGPDQGQSQRNYDVFIKTLERISAGLERNADLLEKDIAVKVALIDAINHQQDGLIPALDDASTDMQEMVKALNAHSVKFGLGSLFAPRRRST